MAAITENDLDRAIITFCYEADDRMSSKGRLRFERLLPWAFVQFPDSNDPRYITPLTGNNSVGVGAVGSQPYFSGSEYMRCAPFPHEADIGNRYTTDPDTSKAGPFAIHFFGPV